MLAGGVRGEKADPLVLHPRIGQPVDALERGIALAVNQDIGRMVIGVGVLDQPGALGISHDEVTGVAAQRVWDIARPFLEPDIFEGRVKLGRDQLGELILEAFSLRVGKGHVVGVGANPDQAGTQLARRERLPGRAECGSRASEDEEPCELKPQARIGRIYRPEPQACLFGAVT